MCTLPEVGQRYGNSSTALEVFKSAPEDVASDFPAQVSCCAELSYDGGITFAVTHTRKSTGKWCKFMFGEGNYVQLLVTILIIDDNYSSFHDSSYQFLSCLRVVAAAPPYQVWRVICFCGICPSIVLRALNHSYSYFSIVFLCCSESPHVVATV